MEYSKAILDLLAENPKATLVCRDGILQRGIREPLTKAVRKGKRNTIHEEGMSMDKAMLQILEDNPGMELQLLSSNTNLPPYWIIYLNAPGRKIKLPKYIFVDCTLNAICFKRRNGEIVMLASINP